MNLDPFPGTVTPSRRSVLHRARPVEQPRHGIVSGNNDAAARGIAAAVLRRYCQELSCERRDVDHITPRPAQYISDRSRSAGGKPVIGTARSGRGLTEILSPTGAPRCGALWRRCGDQPVFDRFRTRAPRAFAAHLKRPPRRSCRIPPRRTVSAWSSARSPWTQATRET